MMPFGTLGLRTKLCSQRRPKTRYFSNQTWAGFVMSGIALSRVLTFDHGTGLKRKKKEALLLRPVPRSNGCKRKKKKHSGVRLL